MGRCPVPLFYIFSAAKSSSSVSYQLQNEALQSRAHADHKKTGKGRKWVSRSSMLGNASKRADREAFELDRITGISSTHSESWGEL